MPTRKGKPLYALFRERKNGFLSYALLFVVLEFNKQENKINTLKDLSFWTVFNSAANAMMLIEDSGQIISINPVAQQLFGHVPDKTGGVAIEMLIVPRYRKLYRCHQEIFFKNLDKHSKSVINELVALDINHNEILLDISFNPVIDKKQHYALIICNAISPRFETEEALRASEERLRLAKEAAGLGIFDYDLKHNIVYWDEQMRKLWGKDSDETVSYEEFVARIHPEDREARQGAINKAMNPAGNGEFRAEYRVINQRDGVTCWISSRGQVYFENGQPERLVGVTRDVTEQKNIQKKLQAQRDETEIIFKQQVAALTASAIAHELNQPLAAVSAYGEVALHALHNDVFDPDNLKRALEGSVEQAQRAGQSLHELLAFLQKGEFITERSNLNEIINEALNILDHDGYGEFKIEFDLQQNLPDVQCNRIQVQKVLINLFRNAIEAMRAINFPTLTITTRAQTLAEENSALVIIQDNGQGLDRVIVKRIFEPFITSKSSGIGMGLSISRSLIEANGGRLWVDSRIESGAKFYFTLPLA